MKLSPHLKQISNTSEQLSDSLRQRLQQRFGVAIVDHYATGECLFVSEGCPTDVGAHINADWAILEVVDENDRPVAMGQVGKRVLITNLANFVQPFIRYEIEDMLQLTDKPCRCGSRLPRIERIQGRTSELFWVGDGPNKRFLNYAVFQRRPTTCVRCANGRPSCWPPGESRCASNCCRPLAITRNRSSSPR